MVNAGGVANEIHCIYNQRVKRYMNYHLFKILKIYFSPLFLILFIVITGGHHSLVYAVEQDLNKKIFRGYYFIYIIYENREKNFPILYTTYTFLPDVESQGEVPEKQVLLKPGSYTMESEASYNALDFELELTENGKTKRFNFNLNDNQFYYILIRIDKYGNPIVKWLTANKGRELIKRYDRAKLMYEITR